MTTFDDKPILAIDTATSQLRLALQFGGDRTVTIDETVGTSHGQVLVRKVEDLLASSGLETYQLEALVVCTGPGSFTGLRIGLAAAKGIAVALDLPLVGVSLFEIAAQKLRAAAGRVAVVIPFKRGELYLGWVADGRHENADVLAVPVPKLLETLGRAGATGLGLDLAQVLPDHDPQGIPGEITYTGPDLLRLGLDKLNRGEIPDLNLLEPLYVTRSTAEIRYDQRRKG